MKLHFTGNYIQKKEMSYSFLVTILFLYFLYAQINFLIVLFVNPFKFSYPLLTSYHFLFKFVIEKNFNHRSFLHVADYAENKYCVVKFSYKDHSEFRQDLY